MNEKPKEFKIKIFEDMSITANFGANRELKIIADGRMSGMFEMVFGKEARNEMDDFVKEKMKEIIYESKKIMDKYLDNLNETLH